MLNTKTTNTAGVPDNFGVGRIVRVKADAPYHAGTRGFITQIGLAGISKPGDPVRCQVTTDTKFGYSSYIQTTVENLHLEPKKTSFPKGYSLEEDFLFLQSWAKGFHLPNAQIVPEEDWSQMLATIAAGGNHGALTTMCWTSLPPQEGQPLWQSEHKEWSAVWLYTAQMGGYTGEGFAIRYLYGKGQIVKFAICQHDATDEGTPGERMRGWHPARCAKCGMDLSVDSSD